MGFFGPFFGKKYFGHDYWRPKPKINGTAETRPLSVSGGSDPAYRRRMLPPGDTADEELALLLAMLELEDEIT